MIVANDADRRRLLEYGDTETIGSLPVIEFWRTWWSAWGPLIAADVGREGWVLFLFDANEKAIELEGIMARILRDKPTWGTAMWSQKEWMNIKDTAGEALAWFDRNAPRKDRVPEWAAFLLCGLRAHFTVLARLGSEIRAAQDQGYSAFVVESQTDRLGMDVIKGGDKILGECE